MDAHSETASVSSLEAEARPVTASAKQPKHKGQKRKTKNVCIKPACSDDEIPSLDDEPAFGSSKVPEHDKLAKTTDRMARQAKVKANSLLSKVETLNGVAKKYGIGNDRLETG